MSRSPGLVAPASSRRSAPPREKPNLSDSVQFLPGVGPRRAESLASLGIQTVSDLLEHFPVRYEKQEFLTIEKLDPGIVATIVGQVRAVRVRRGRGGIVVNASMTDNTARCSLSWFNAAYVADRLEAGCIIRATGRVTEFGGLPQMVNPRFTVLSDNAAPVDEAASPQLEPVYPACAAIDSRAIARLIGSNLDALLADLPEWHTEPFRRQRRLLTRREAMRKIHRPLSEAEHAEARRTLAYDELLLMQLAVQSQRAHRRFGEKAPVLPCTQEIDRRIRRRFTFRLTVGQEQAIRVLVRDLAQSRPMQRLLQGDVGCGKTVVALYAALVAVAHRRQAAILAPTELLAEQHYRSIEKYLAGSRVRFALFTGRLSVRARRELVRKTESGELDLVVGTHALLGKDLQFARLGLVIVDEQHRFGVRQRATLRSKGGAPHYLVMTATPIPRTLAMTVFGDLDVTTIPDMPPGRSPIRTHVFDRRIHDSAWSLVRSRLNAGEQAFVVYPVIDESDRTQLRAATVEFRRLRDTVFSGFNIGLMHGRLPAEEREATMNEFVTGRLAALVATSVVEVGIDVPNATCMLIEHAERYGLSQLHQLRGRVGRGTKAGHCLLLTDSHHPEDNARLAILSRTSDGFRIAEEDLRLRGPGEMLGTRQHGLPALHAADLMGDTPILRAAQQDADRILRQDPRLQRPEYIGLRAALHERYRGRIGFLTAG